MEEARESPKNIYFCSIDYAKAIDCVAHNKLWKILKEMGIPDHLTCLIKYRHYLQFRLFQANIPKMIQGGIL